MTQLDLQQRLEQAETHADNGWKCATALAEHCDNLQQQVKDLQDKFNFKQNLTEQVVDLQKQVNALAAENLSLKSEKPNFTSMQNALIAFYSDDEVPEMQMLRAFNILRNVIKTPVTDTIKRQWKAEGVDDFGKYIALYHSDSVHHAKQFAAQLRQPEEKGHE